MSKEQLKAFQEKVKDDSSLQEKLKGVSDANAIAAITKEAGFMISADDLTKAQSELSDEELEGVAGGSGTEAARLAMDDHLKRRKIYCALRTPAK
jgi:predicted ribosomally synthesized peptide with nif11-like leader